MIRLSLLYLLVGLLTVACSRNFEATAPYTIAPAPGSPGSSVPPQQPPAPPKRLFLANDRVRVAIDLSMGGAINYLAEAGSSENMVNNFDLGRQLQTSLYSGPIYYVVNGKTPVEQWKYLGWNPVQTGDYYKHPARVVSYQQTSNSLYIKTVPLIWPLFDEPADCVMEHWVTIQANTVHVRSRTLVNRTDTTHYDARTQEAPCVYLNGAYHRRVGYTGLQPFTNGPVSEFTEDGMTDRYGTENWMALLNDKGRGVGLLKPGEYRFHTAYFGNVRSTSEYDESSGYMNSSPFVQIDHNGQYEFEYTLVVGSLADIRQAAYALPRPPTGPNYRFSNDRLGWHYYNTHDRGWPIENELAVRWQRDDTTKARFRVMAPMGFWRATDVPKIYVQAAFTTKASTARLSWRKPEDYDFFDQADRFVDFPITGDGAYRTYEIDLTRSPYWNGVISQIGLTTPDDQRIHEKGAVLRLRSVTMTPP